MTNSTEEGMLHVGPNNEGCDTIAEVVKVLLPPSFRSLIQQSINSALFLVACGSVITLNDPLKELRNIYDETIFKQILTFSQEQFQVAYTTYFLQDFMLQYFVYNRLKVEAILTQHQSLGAHSDIIPFRAFAEGEAHLCERLVWAHPGIKPVGIPAPLQCEACGSIRPWQLKGKPNGNTSEKNFVIQQCKWGGCGSRTGPGIQYNLPESMKRVKEPVAKNDSRGGWVLEKVFEGVAVHGH